MSAWDGCAGFLGRLSIVLLAAACGGLAQSHDEDFRVYSDAPRLLLTRQRLRLLQR